MPDEESTELLGVIERQQQQIEALRTELEAANMGPGSPSAWSLTRRDSSASLACSAASEAISVLPMRGDASELPIDSEQYAKICNKMEEMRASLARKSARLLKAQAKASGAGKEAARLREVLAGLRSEAESQRAQTKREQNVSMEAVEDAVEKAAQAMAKNDQLSFELSRLKDAQIHLRAELKWKDMAMKEIEAARRKLHNELERAQQKALRLTKCAGVLQRDNGVLQSECRRVKQELEEKRTSDHAWEAIIMKTQTLQTRVTEQDEIIQQQAAQLEHQATQIEQQQAQIQCLHEELQTAEAKQIDSKHHAAHLLKINFSLQHDLDCERFGSSKVHEQHREARETAELLGEELLQTRNKVLWREREVEQRDEKLGALTKVYRHLERHTHGLEFSKRELVSVLIPTKKRLSLLQDTLTKFCYELEGVTKQMVSSRNRELSLGRALREYGKRNRELQASVVSARHELHSVVNAFRSSERRKAQAVSANWTLKRDLVVEYCQRTDLLRRCKELEGCLDSCQSSALESQKRAEVLEEDNGTLHLAVTQLVAYARELTNSQQSLQQELTKLEVAGKREPAVYG